MNPLQRYLEGGDQTFLEEAIKTAQRRLDRLAHSSNQPDKDKWLGALGTCLMHRFTHSRHRSDLIRAISCFRQSVELVPNAYKPQYLGALARALHIRGEEFPENRINDQDDEIRTLNQAYMHTAMHIPDSAGQQAVYLRDIGAILLARFADTSALRDLRGALAAFERCVITLPDDASKQRRDCLFGWAVAEMHYFDLTDDHIHILSAIEKLRAAIKNLHSNDAQYAIFAYHLGFSLRKEIEKSGQAQEAVLHESVNLLQTAFDSLKPSDDPLLRATRENNLGSSLLCRFVHIGGSKNKPADDLESAVEHMRNAVKLGASRGSSGKDQSLLLFTYSNALHRRFDHFHLLPDIDSSISHFDSALSISVTQQLHELQLKNDFASALQCRFHHTGKEKDLDRAIQLLMPLLDLKVETSAEERVLGKCCTGLAIAHITRFVHKGHIEDLDQAVTAAEHAIPFFPQSHFDSYHAYSVLGAAHYFRFERHRKLPDIDTAIEKLEHAASGIPDSHILKPVIMRTIGNAFHARFEHGVKVVTADEPHDEYYLDKAVNYLTNAHSLTATLDHHHLEGLGDVHQTRFKHRSDVKATGDIDSAVTWHREAAKLVPSSHAQRYTHLTSFGNSLHLRYMFTKQVADLLEAVKVKREAVNLMPKGHAQRAALLVNLGASLARLYEVTKHLGHVKDAVEAFGDAAQSEIGPSVIRLHAAHRAATLSFQHISKKSSLEFYNRAMNLIPSVAWLGSNVKDRLEDLPQVQSMVNDAVAAAISLKQYTTAVEWLEQGRCVCWSQILALRTPIQALRDQHPQLAEQFEAISFMLDRAGTEDSMSQAKTMVKESLKIDGHSPPTRTKHDEAKDHHNLAKRHQELVQTIRKKPGFEDFFEPSPFKKLAAASKESPIVFLFAHSIGGCYALVVRSEHAPPECIALSDFTLEKADILVKDLNEVAVGERSRGAAPGKNNGRSDIQLVLELLWHDVVRPLLKELNLLSSALPRSAKHSAVPVPHITWLPTGPFVYLPIHAAGYYGNGGSKQACNHVVSSYTISITAMLEARSHPMIELDLAKTEVLAVSQPRTEGLPALPEVTSEINMLRQSFQISSSFSSALVTHLSEKAATVQDIMNKLKTSSFVHLACHGEANRDPTQSSFILSSASNRLTLQQLIRRDVGHHSSHRLAVLSACMTAVGSERVPEEVVHLAAGMLLAGFPNVVATMWSIRDKDAPVIMRHFYDHLLKASGKGQMHRRDVACALHEAIQKLRASLHSRPQEEQLLRWVQFVHFMV